MKNLILTLTILTFSISLFGQTVTYPTINRKTENDVYIKSVSITDYYTQINFIYKNSKSEGHYILLNPSGHKDAYFIKANGRTYKLLSTQNIGSTDGITAAYPGQRVEFSARFEKLPSYTESFDLIEGATGTWDFYGIQLSNSVSSSVEKFRVDYDYVAIYNPETETWSDWKEGENTFVININERGDIAHLKANGETVIYKKLSGVEEGYTSEGYHHYQIISALDTDGDVFRFQIFDDKSIGLKMMWGAFMIQFALSP